MEDNSAIIKEVVDILSRQGDDMVTKIREALMNANKLATGQLYNSVLFDVSTSQGIVTLIVQALEYIKYVDLGRKPGSKQPPIAAILEWISIRGIKPRDIPSGKKSIPIKDESLAFLIARSIGRDGIPASGVIQNPFNQTKDKNMNDISMALAKGNHNATGKMLEDLAAQYQDNNIKIQITY